jgi:hypothetical protein
MTLDMIHLPGFLGTSTLTSLLATISYKTGIWLTGLPEECNITIVNLGEYTGFQLNVRVLQEIS